MKVGLVEVGNAVQTVGATSWMVGVACSEVPSQIIRDGATPRADTQYGRGCAGDGGTCDEGLVPLLKGCYSIREYARSVLYGVNF